MARYVIVLRGQEPRPEDLALIGSTPGIKVVDQTFNRAMLLEGSEQAVSALSDRLKDWLIASEVSYGRPELGPREPSSPEDPRAR
jgi:hypothetical protein